MKYCAHCGAEMYDDAVICTKCGCAADGMRSPYNTPSNSWNILAIIGLVMSFFSTVVGLVLSIIAYKQVKNTGEKGRELALAGIVISSVEIAIALFVMIIYLCIFFAVLGSRVIY